jgi:hypothetical protein
MGDAQNDRDRPRGVDDCLAPSAARVGSKDAAHHRYGRSTYSIVGADPEAGKCGMAVQSKFLAVGAFVPWTRGAIGAVATQALAEINPPTNLPAPRQGSWDTKHIGETNPKSHRNLPRVRSINGLLGITAGPRHFRTSSNCQVRAGED